MTKAIVKLILIIFIVLVAIRQLPALHNATKQLLAKRAQKGFSSLESFNNQLWKK